MTYTLRISMRRMICLPVPTVWCSVPRADVVLWSSPLRSQHSAAPPTARPNDNHPAVTLRYRAAKPGQKTSQLTIADGRSTIEDPSPTHGGIECWKHSETSVHQSFLRWDP
ncbi:hypothetical protein K443DRAFT_684375 [Laccaria amethystina LaAM-08-1]|uniref:Uncharacterized protein n=1 Tax=Laccaria amethystina LaAM-08-1 TaxID=1095629 RepID=A0A0C9WQY3_9AGAR|nr:hypothetical protein K443DRAFT_684375 [Laccaria amethystina LaAM-08-1]